MSDDPLDSDALDALRDAVAIEPSRRDELFDAIDDILCAVGGDESARPGNLALAEEMVSLSRALASDPLADDWSQDRVCIALDWRARFRLGGGDYAGGTEDALEALRLVRAARVGGRAQQSVEIAALELAADGLENLSDELDAAHDHEKAVQTLVEALALRRELQRADPLSARAGCAVAVDLRLIDWRTMRDRTETERADAQREMIDECERLRSQFPLDLGVATELQKALGCSGWLLPDGDLNAEIRHLTRRIELTRELVAGDVEDALDDIQEDLRRLGECHAELGSHLEAALAFREAIAHLRVFRASPKADEPDDYSGLSLSLALGDLRDVLGQLGDRDAQTIAEAVSVSREALEFSRAFAAEEPTDPEMTRELVVDLDELGDWLTAAADFSGAAVAYDEAESIARALVLLDPTRTRFRDDLAIALRRHGRLARRTGSLAAASSYFEQSCAERRVLVGVEPAESNWRSRLGWTLIEWATVLSDSGEHTAALERFDEGIVLVRETRDKSTRYEDARLVESIEAAAASAASIGRPDRAVEIRAIRAELGL